MRIGYLTYGLDRDPTGIGRYAVELLRALKTLPNAPEIVLLTTERADPFGLWAEFEHHALPGCQRLPSLMSLGSWRLAEAIKKYQLDIIHDPNGIAPFFGSASGAKRLVTIHDAFPYVYPETHNRLDNWRFRWMLPRAVQRADMVLTDSQNSRVDLIKYLNLPESKIRAIACGVNSSFKPVPESPARAQLLARYGIKPPYLLYVGGITPRKNISGLLEAYARLRPRYPGLSLVIGGKRQWQAREIDDTFGRLGLAQLVHFTGYVADEDLSALYSAAELFVFPSLYEGFGLPPLEAMACGTPVITTNVSSLPEVVGEAALLVDPRDTKSLSEAIERGLNDPLLRAELRQKGLAQADHFNWEQTARQTLAIYQELFAKPVAPVSYNRSQGGVAEVKIIYGGDNQATTGLSRYARSLHQALADSGVNAELGGSGLPPLPRIVFRVAKRGGFDLKTFFTTYPIALPPKLQGQILHLSSQNLASAAAFARKRPLIVTVHDLITIAGRRDPELTDYLRFYDRIFDRLMARGLKRASLLVADSEYTRWDIIRHLGYPAERVKVVYLGVDHQNFRPQEVPPEFFARYNLSPNKIYLVYAGSEDPRKNLLRLLQAFALVAKDSPEVELLKIGAARFGAERNRLLAYIEANGLTDKVRFFEGVTDADLACFYNIATAFVFPSLAEGFGLPPLEAMACGTPVICSNATSLPEVVGEAGMLVNPYDVGELAEAIQKVLQNPVLQADLSQKGLARAASFTWDKTAAAMLQVYHKESE